MSIEESLAEMAAAHGQRMRGISDAAVDTSEKINAEMMRHVRDPLQHYRDLAAEQLGLQEPPAALVTPTVEATSPEMIS